MSPSSPRKVSRPPSKLKSISNRGKPRSMVAVPMIVPLASPALKAAATSSTT